jgi:2,3,4,5-tetrahydropyridine-2,6-dicarboxylate N-succinyltransferase
MEHLKEAICRLATESDSTEREETDALEILDSFLSALNRGDIRAAELSTDGEWIVNPWVKRGIMVAFRMGRLANVAFAGEQFLDRDTLPVRRFLPDEGVRIVPGGTSVRSGSYIAPGVVIMPPSYVNIGAYVGADCMIDSHVLVGSCAQIGSHVHLSAGVQIGGVLEPAGALPVIVEDDAFVGGGCGLFEGILVRRRAVLAPGVNITGSTQLYDLVNRRVIKREGLDPLEIPPGAVVVPGSRPAASTFGQQNGLQLYAPIIVKYRDERTDVATALTEELRGDG